MIGQIDIEKTLRLQPNKECLFVSVATVLNHVVDAVNGILDYAPLEMAMKAEPKVVTMSKDIWHTTDETPKPYEDIAFYVDGYLYSSYYNAQYNQYGIFGADKVEKWCYAKELSSYIPALETELERTRKALDVAKEALNDIQFTDDGNRIVDIRSFAHHALEQITALEQKDK